MKKIIALPFILLVMLTSSANAALIKLDFNGTDNGVTIGTGPVNGFQFSLGVSGISLDLSVNGLPDSSVGPVSFLTYTLYDLASNSLVTFNGSAANPGNQAGYLFSSSVQQYSNLSAGNYVLLVEHVMSTIPSGPPSVIALSDPLPAFNGSISDADRDWQLNLQYEDGLSSPVPEPSSLVLLSLGLVSIAIRRRKV